MIYSRRQLLALAGASAFLAKNGLSCAEDDFYSNRRIGLSFRKAPAWRFISTSDFQCGAAQQILSDSADQRLAEFARSAAVLPAAIVQAPQPPKDDFAAYVSAWSEPLNELIDEGDDSPLKADDLLKEAMRAWGALLDDYSVEGPPLPVANAPTAAISKWGFRFQTDDGRSWLLQLSTVLAVNPPYLLTVHFGRGANRPQDTDPLLRIRRTLRVFEPHPPHSPNAYNADRVRT